MSVTTGMLSSDKQDWETPQEFVDLVSKYLGYEFTLDACAYPHTAKATLFYTEKDDALSKVWEGTVWMNPPYGKQLPIFLQYAYEQSLNGAKIVCLVPARTDTKWFHTIATKGNIVLLEGRINFLQEGKKVGSPAFPSMLVVFDNEYPEAGIHTWSWKNE